MTLNQIKAAADTAKAKTTDKRWSAAIDKAVAGVQGGWVITELAHCVAITTESDKTYFANDKHCQCEAFFRGQACKHRALYRLIQIAEAEPVATKGATRDELIADIKRLGGPNLADALLRRFRCSDLNFFSIDILTAIRAAI